MSKSITFEDLPSCDKFKSLIYISGTICLLKFIGLGVVNQLLGYGLVGLYFIGAVKLWWVDGDLPLMAVEDIQRYNNIVSKAKMLKDLQAVSNSAILVLAFMLGTFGYGNITIALIVAIAALEYSVEVVLSTCNEIANENKQED